MSHDEDIRPLEPIEEEIEVDEPDPIDDPQSYAEERERARILVPNKLVMAVMLLLLILLLASALGVKINIFARDKNLTPGQDGNPTTTRVFGGGRVQGVPGGEGGGNTGEGSEGALPTIDLSTDGSYSVDDLFRPYYDSHGGERIFGAPISPRLTDEHSGRQIQWFERARLEEWPENRDKDPDHYIQPGLLGREFTNYRDFPRQTHFVSRSDLWYFPETQHGVGGRFLQFWLENGGLEVFGYPISEEIFEVLPSDRQQHLVQYFERARFELHVREDGQQEVVLGLLGRALYPEASKPEIIEELIIEPTAVPDPLE